MGERPVCEDCYAVRSSCCMEFEDEAETPEAGGKASSGEGG
ncbi:MAG: hypothetical protein AAGI48_01025 [Verrucomicrobiota bacterium]